MRTPLAMIAAAAAMLAATAAVAHDEFSVTGKITAVVQQSIQVTSSNGQVAKLKLDKDTRVMSAGKRAALKDLKVGQTVKAMGIGDSRKDLTAIDVTIQAAGRAG
jgi:Cu/Ag efflux protein CusF